MSYYSEHKRLKPILDRARQLDIATNPDPRAIFEAGNSGFQVWCIPQDHPQGWNGISMNRGAFSKPSEYVGSVHWKWDADKIVALQLEATAYALVDQKPGDFTQSRIISSGDSHRTIYNREEDIAWLKEKVHWLFAETGVPLMPIEYDPEPLWEPHPHILAHYASQADEYVVIVSPEFDPREFCKPGYEILHELAIWRAGDFPGDVVLRPGRNLLEAEVEQDEGLLVEQYQNASRLGDDGWLEAAFEDQISGWDV